MENKFEHPADAMQARIEGRLHCHRCKHLIAHSQAPYKLCPTYFELTDNMFCHKFALLRPKAPDTIHRPGPSQP